MGAAWYSAWHDRVRIRVSDTEATYCKSIILHCIGWRICVREALRQYVCRRSYSSCVEIQYQNNAGTMEHIYLVLDAIQSRKLPVLVPPSDHRRANAFFTVSIDGSGQQLPQLGVVLKPGFTILPGNVVVCAIGKGKAHFHDTFQPPACCIYPSSAVPEKG